jgi:hypothetical protein
MRASFRDFLSALEANDKDGQEFPAALDNILCGGRVGFAAVAFCLPFILRPANYCHLMPVLTPPNAKPKLLDRVRWHLRVKHYSLRTEQLYLHWIRRFILFHQKRHPAEMGEEEIAAFFTHLAVEGHVAASTQNQAFSALLFLYQQVLDRKLDYLPGVERVKRPPKLPVVLTKKEAHAVIAHLQGDYRLLHHTQKHPFRKTA